jgi:hypothetical protein
MYGVKFLALLMLLVVANSFVNSSDSGGTVGTGVAANASASSEGQPELNPVAAAAEKVEKTSGGRMSLYFVYSSPAAPRPITASGGGIYNEKTGRTRITLEMANPATGDAFRMVQITDGDVEYQGGDDVASVLPPGKEWVRTDKSEKSEDETPLNIDDSLEMLGSSGDVQMVGRESINGKMTRRYRGEVTIGDLVDVLREKGKDVEADAYERIEGTSPTQISAEAWVDRKSLLRRMRIVVPMPGEEGEPTVTVDMRMDFFDYGAEPDIQLPDPATVVEGPLDEAAAPSGSVS